MKKNWRYPPPILPSKFDHEQLAPVNLEFYWNGTHCDIFPLFFKLHTPLLHAVLRQFSFDERKLLHDVYDIPMNEGVEESSGLLGKIKKIYTEDEVSGIFNFIKKVTGDDGEKNLDPSPDEMAEEEAQISVAQRLQELSERSWLKRENIFAFYLEHPKDSLGLFDQQEEKELRQNNIVLHCIYELLTLCEEPCMTGTAHPLMGQGLGSAFKKDYSHLLIAYACRESCISGYQLLYLESVIRQFHLDPQWFQETLEKCLEYSTSQRKNEIFEIISSCSLLDKNYNPILLEDCLALNLLCDPKTVQGDKIQLPQSLCKDKQKRSNLSQEIKNKLRGVSL